MMNMKDVYEFGTKVPLPETMTYQTSDTHGFGWALEAMKEGHDVTREVWNGDLWLTLQMPDENSKMARPYIYMGAVNDELVPWVAVQTDLLAEDWSIFEGEGD